MIGGLSAVALLFFVLRLHWLGAAVALLGAFTAFFFRDPERAIPVGADVVVAPADGRVVRIAAAPEGNPVGPGAQQVSIFLSIFDVHINRAPAAGRVASVEYHEGEFLPAFDHDASHRNERNEVVLERDGQRIAFTQIAGLIARRIVFRPGVGDELERGQRVGMIRFGSRVDLVLPQGARLAVAVGDRVRGGASVLAEVGP